MRGSKAQCRRSRMSGPRGPSSAMSQGPFQKRRRRGVALSLRSKRREGGQVFPDSGPWVEGQAGCVCVQEAGQTDRQMIRDGET